MCRTASACGDAGRRAKFVRGDLGEGRGARRVVSGVTPQQQVPVLFDRPATVVLEVEFRVELGGQCRQVADVDPLLLGGQCPLGRGIGKPGDIRCRRDAHGAAQTLEPVVVGEFVDGPRGLPALGLADGRPDRRRVLDQVLGRTDGVHEVVAGGRRVQSRVVEPFTVGRVAQALIVGHRDDVSGLQERVDGP